MGISHQNKVLIFFLPLINLLFQYAKSVKKKEDCKVALQFVRNVIEKTFNKHQDVSNVHILKKSISKQNNANNVTTRNTKGLIKCARCVILYNQSRKVIA